MSPVVADADTLFGATTRGLLIHLDYEGLIRLHWSPLILDELSRALVDTGRKPHADAAWRHEQLMRGALPQAEIPTAEVQAQFKVVTAAMRSAKDVHVAACAHAVLAGSYYPERYPSPSRKRKKHRYRHQAHRHVHQRQRQAGFHEVAQRVAAR